MQLIKNVLMAIFAVLFVGSGVNHIVNPQFYLSIMPPYLPWPYELVIISGVAEVVLGIGLLIPKSRRLAAWGLILLLIAIFPANIHMAMHPELYPEIPELFLWIRLPLQGVMVLWGYWYTRPVRSNRMYTPFRR